MEDFTDLTITGKINANRYSQNNNILNKTNTLGRCRANHRLARENMPTVDEDEKCKTRPKFAQSRFVFSDSAIKSLTRSHRSGNKEKSSRNFRNISIDRRAGSESNLKAMQLRKDYYTETPILLNNITTTAPLILNPTINNQMNIVSNGLPTCVRQPQNSLLSSFVIGTPVSSQAQKSNLHLPSMSTVSSIFHKNKSVSSLTDIRRDYQNIESQPPRSCLPPPKPPRLSPTLEQQIDRQLSGIENSHNVDANLDVNNYPMNRERWLELQRLFQQQQEELNMIQQQHSCSQRKIETTGGTLENLKPTKLPLSIYPSTSTRPKYAQLQDFRPQVPQLAHISFPTTEVSNSSDSEPQNQISYPKMLTKPDKSSNEIQNNSQRSSKLTEDKSEQQDTEVTRIHGAPFGSHKLLASKSENLNDRRELAKLNTFQPVISPSEESILKSIDNVAGRTSSPFKEENTPRRSFSKKYELNSHGSTKTRIDPDETTDHLHVENKNINLRINRVPTRPGETRTKPNAESHDSKSEERNLRLFNPANVSQPNLRQSTKQPRPESSSSLQFPEYSHSRNDFSLPEKVPEIGNAADEYDLGDFMLNPQQYSSPDDFRYSLIIEKQDTPQKSGGDGEKHREVNHVHSSILSSSDCKESII